VRFSPANWPWLTFALAVSLSCVSTAAEIKVDSQQEYRDAVKNLQPGDTVVLANGEWRDFEILFLGEGTAEQPITLTVEEKGEVLVTGRSNLRLAGKHLVVSGLVFRDGHSPSRAVIEFRRDEENLAYHSRVTEVVIDSFNKPERFNADSWVVLYGKHNRLDHSYLSGKDNRGVTVIVRLNTEESQENHHRVDHNYFGPRQLLGSNGGESFRIGTSTYSLTDSFTVVEDNYFDRCDGEVEIISNKAGSNVFRGNLFYESRGTLTMRHGNNNLIENNVFFGNRVAHTGGIRVINKGQVVRNNYMHGLTGHRFGGGFVVMNGVPNSRINRYHQVDNALIENNSIIDSDHIELAAGSDEERTAPPVNSEFRNNLVYTDGGNNNIAVHDDISGIRFSGNVSNLADSPLHDGFATREIVLEKAANGLLYATDPEVAGKGVGKELSVLSRDETGPSWYPKPGYGGRFDSGATHSVGPGLDTLDDVVARASAGDVVEMAGGDYIASRTIVIDKPVTIRSDGDARIRFDRTALFEITEGGGLKLDGVTIEPVRVCEQLRPGRREFGRREPEYGSLVQFSHHNEAHVCRSNRDSQFSLPQHLGLGTGAQGRVGRPWYLQC
jgi:poly(beta-D-mannuronate) lyase